MFQVGHRVPERHRNAPFDELVDCLGRPLLLWRQRDDGNVVGVAVDLVNRFEAFVEFTDAVSWMSALLVDGDEWAFDMNAQHRRAVFTARLLLD